MKKLLALVAGLLLSSAALAAVYIGYNPVTGLNGQLGVPVAAGTLPVLDATTSCGTLATVQASQVGGAATFQVTSNSTTCTLVVDLPAAAPNGYFCVAVDETTPADAVHQSAHSTTQCTVTGTTVSGDKILVEINGF